MADVRCFSVMRRNRSRIGAGRFGSGSRSTRTICCRCEWTEPARIRVFVVVTRRLSRNNEEIGIFFLLKVRIRASPASFPADDTGPE